MHESMSRLALVAALGCHSAFGHGQITFPPNRQNTSLDTGGSCDSPHYGSCLWFSEMVSIPGEPTVNDAHFRTYNVNISAGSKDWTRTNPWRAPGSAPVFGSGCGAAGGGPVKIVAAGGITPPGFRQGDDAVKVLPASASPAIWSLGSTQEVGWALHANHGGGYAYRLCRNDGKNVVSEECFQRTHLRFAGDVQWIREINGTRHEIPLVRISEGTQPLGSEWARNPVPACNMCDTTDCGNLTSDAGIRCAQSCAGYDLDGAQKGLSPTCPEGKTQFPAPITGFSGYTRLPLNGFAYSIVDAVVVPRDLEPGSYLLSWRWDAEQTAQIWQNCADVQIAEAGHIAV